ncbi:cytochrome c oxidase subunit 3 [Pseudomonas synxantha]|uniref:cytochrome c oxidase subunit 3 n=1 Tax=Pseudomonas synxantha TaxID=47883 RepID=UPI0027935101|nr:cytochrome c oxidase subunit 3 [Pseudomonas synxantha]MDQ0981206.1 cytochrome c oxidase subunit 3 [Pseudomonas synxantha]
MIRFDERPAAPFAAFAQQRDAARLGMWLFLASEAMMFGSLILVAWFLRLQHPDGVAQAVAKLHYLLASANTVLLLTSSLLMTLAMAAKRPHRIRRHLLGAALLGLLFLGLKGVEYGLEWQEGVLPGFSQGAPWQLPSAQLFMNLYLLATALHGVHVLVAVGLALWLYRALGRCALAPRQASTRLEMTALYWHLVDAIWIVLFPTLYLVGR